MDDTPAATTQARRLVPADPSEDELARHWSLTPADLALIAECRGPDHRRRFALQLCVMRAYGRFLDDYRHAPIKIVNHLSRQLGLPPVLFLDRPGREPTERVQAQRIRRYLAVRRFNKMAEANLREWLRAVALEGRTAGELLNLAEEKLRGWQVSCPAPARWTASNQEVRRTSSLPLSPTPRPACAVFTAGRRAANRERKCPSACKG